MFFYHVIIATFVTNKIYEKKDKEKRKVYLYSFDMYKFNHLELICPKTVKKSANRIHHHYWYIGNTKPKKKPRDFK